MDIIGKAGGRKDAMSRASFHRRNSKAVPAMMQSFVFLLLLCNAPSGLAAPAKRHACVQGGGTRNRSSTSPMRDPAAADDMPIVYDGSLMSSLLQPAPDELAPAGYTSVTLILPGGTHHKVSISGMVPESSAMPSDM